MIPLLKYLEGKKTHLSVAVIFILLFGTWQKWWVIPESVYIALLGAGLSFLRMGVKKSKGKKEDRDPLDSLPDYPPARPDRGCVSETSRSSHEPATPGEPAAAGRGDTAAVHNPPQ